MYSCSTDNAKNEKWGLQFDETNVSLLSSTQPSVVISNFFNCFVPIVQPSVFQIVSGLSGKCLTAESSGTWIDQWECSPYTSAPHQWWKMKELSSIPTALVSELGFRTHTDTNT